MQLTHINLTDLKPSPLNVRKYKAKAVDDLVHSIRTHGLLQPLLVRPNGEGYEIVAGQRRYHACLALMDEDVVEQTTTLDPVPCLVMDDEDDATAIEASLAENIARLPMDEIDQYKAFAALHSQGKSVDEIASQFGVTERLVNQRLAIARLHGPILTAYRKGDIRPETLRMLTMATKKQQKGWFELYRSDDDYAPTGRALKDWLFGGGHVPVRNALFDVAASGLAVVSDLFGEEAYFADSSAFWEAQSAAVAEKVEAHKQDGWSEVQVNDVGAYFARWNHVKVPKSKGGVVHITCAKNGEVEVFEGYLDQKTYRKRQKAKAKGSDKVIKPELTKALQNHLALHRHAAVRNDLFARPDIALRLTTAHMIAGSHLWCVEPEPQKADKDTIAESLVATPYAAVFAAARKEIAKLLGFEEDEEGPITHRSAPFREGRDLAKVFARLLTLSNDEVQRIQSFVIAETLECGTGIIEVLGAMMETDLTQAGPPDMAFFDLLRDKEVINAMLTEIAGPDVANANLTATAKVQKSIIIQCLDGTRVPKVQNWQPRYMQFPMQAYTERGGIAVMDAEQEIAKHFETEAAQAEAA